MFQCFRVQAFIRVRFYFSCFLGDRGFGFGIVVAGI